jgi:succinoglycan biosynthesis transport protein ExoP
MADMFRARPVTTQGDPALSELTRNTLKGLRRNIWMVVACALLFTALSVVFISTRVATYEAQASLMIDPRIAASNGGAAAVPALFINDELIVDSEIAVLQSDRLLRRVAQTLPAPAVHDAEDQNDAPGALSILLGRLDPRSWFGASDTDAAVKTEQERLADAVDWLRREIAIQRQGTTYVIGLSFSAEDPDLAVQVVNSVAEGYIALFGEEQLEQSRRMSDWLGDEIVRLSETLARLEAEATAFRSDNDLPMKDEGNAVLQEIADIDAEAIDMRAEIRTARAELESILLDLDRLEDPLYLGRLTSAAFEDADLEALQFQLRTIQQSENAESDAQLYEFVVSRLRARLERLRDTREAQIEVAQATLDGLAREKDALEREATRISEAQIPLRAKERQIQALQVQYAALSKQLQDRETATRFTASNARIIDLALPPPGPLEDDGIGLRILVGAMIAGTVLGLALVFLREQLDDRVRSSRDIIDGLDLPYVGAIPVLPWRRLSAPEAIAPWLNMTALTRRERRQVAHLFAGSRHSSRRFADTLRRAASMLRTQAPPPDPRGGRDGPRLVLVTSARSGDGKTTFTANLAAFLAEQGQSVLLVDGDPGDHTLSRLMAPALSEENRRDLQKADNSVDTNQALILTPRSPLVRVDALGPHLTVLTATSDHLDDDPTGYVNALRMVLTAHAQSADLVLVDASSLTSTVEDLVEMPGSPQVFLVARFGGISTSALRATLQQRPMIASKIIGSFVSRVKERELKLYEPLTD